MSRIDDLPRSATLPALPDHSLRRIVGGQKMPERVGCGATAIDTIYSNGQHSADLKEDDSCACDM